MATPMCLTLYSHRLPVLPLPLSYSTLSKKHAQRALFARIRLTREIFNKKLFVTCNAVGDGTQGTGDTVYQGVYGPWSIDAADNREVILYRAGLVTSAASFVVAASAAFLTDDFFAKSLLQQNFDTLYALGVGGLGLSLVLIHIYVTPIKRTLQILWAVGMLGSLSASLNLAQPAGEGLVQYVIENPVAVWFIGPVFAALTGLVFKEGLCYGKLEAAVLTFVIPTLLLGHLTGFMDDQLKLGLLGLWMVLFMVFAARKFTQPIKGQFILGSFGNGIVGKMRLHFSAKTTYHSDIDCRHLFNFWGSILFIFSHQLFYIISSYVRLNIKLFSRFYVMAI